MQSGYSPPGSCLALPEILDPNPPMDTPDVVGVAVSLGHTYKANHSNQKASQYSTTHHTFRAGSFNTVWLMMVKTMMNYESHPELNSMTLQPPQLRFALFLSLCKASPLSRPQSTELLVAHGPPKVRQTTGYEE